MQQLRILLASQRVSLWQASFNPIQMRGASLARPNDHERADGRLVMQNSCGHSYQETDSSSWLLWVVGFSRLSQMAQLKLFLLHQNPVASLKLRDPRLDRMFF